MSGSKNLYIAVMTGALLLLGCAGARVVSAGASVNTTTSNSSGNTTPPNTPSHLQSPSILVSESDTGGERVIVFDGSAAGETKPYWTLPGTHPHLDAAGNIYVVRSFQISQRIEVYGPDLSSTTPVRFLPAGPGTKIPALKDVTVSGMGEIFVADGKGVAVFAPNATGDADPVRYIQWTAPPEGVLLQSWNITVDDSDNLYVRNGTVIAVFGPNDNGTATPTRLITGPQTQIATSVYEDGYTWSMTIDSHGNIYLLCNTVRQDGLNPFGVLVFGPGSNGDVAPVRYVTTPGMNDGEYGTLTGLAVDSSGSLFVSATLSPDYYPAGLYVFPPGAAGSITPSRIVQTPRWFHIGDVLWEYNGGGIALVQ